jgi:glycerophosphoryl diester phosphodiesterase
MLHLLLIVLTISGCKKQTNQHVLPIVQGHKISSAQKNTRASLEYAYKHRYPSIEIDVSLTSDLVLIYHHDYWLNNRLCSFIDGSPLSHKHLIKDFTFEELSRTFRCMGPYATEKNTILSIDELLSSSLLLSDVLINLDIKYDQRFTLSSEKFSKAITDLVQRYPNRKLMISTSNSSISKHLKKTINIPIFIEYPFFSSANHDIYNMFIALNTRVKHVLHFTRFADIVEKSQADGISLPFQIVRQNDIIHLQKRGIKTQIWTANTAKDLKKLCSWAIDVLISDSPELAPCFRPSP